MISLVRAAWQEELRTPMFVGLSTDGFPAKTEPAMKNGARCYHMDTAKEYEYSAEDEQWYEVPQSGGGGGGLPPVTGSGKALVSVNGQWKQQEGYPYDEGETVTTLFDETFSGFVYDEDNEQWKATVPFSGSIPDEIETARVYIDGTIDTAAYYGYQWIDFNDGGAYIEINTGEQTATCGLYSSAYDTAPESISIKLEEVEKHIVPIDPAYLGEFGLPDAFALSDGTALVVVGGQWKEQIGYAYSKEDFRVVAAFPAELFHSGDTELDSDYSFYDGDSVYYRPYFGAEPIEKTAYKVDGDDSGKYAIDCYDDLLFIYDENTGKNYLRLIDMEYAVFDSGQCIVEPGEVSTPFYEGYIPWSNAPEGTGLPELPWEDGTYTLKANVEAGEPWFEWAQGGDSGVVVTAENNTTVNNYQVPQLTAEQVQTAYNAVATGKSVTIIDATETMMFSGINADVVSDEIFISFRYFDKMILEYDENGTINYTAIVSATEVQNMINAAISDAIGGSY